MLMYKNYINNDNIMSNMKINIEFLILFILVFFFAKYIIKISDITFIVLSFFIVWILYYKIPLNSYNDEGMTANEYIKYCE